MGIYHFEFNFFKNIIFKISLWSYSLYIWNNLVARLIVKLNFQSFLISFTLFFALTIFISFISYEIIEKKILNLRSKLLFK